IEERLRCFAAMEEEGGHGAILSDFSPASPERSRVCEAKPKDELRDVLHKSTSRFAPRQARGSLEKSRYILPNLRFHRIFRPRGIHDNHSKMFLRIAFVSCVHAHLEVLLFKGITS